MKLKRWWSFDVFRNKPEHSIDVTLLVLSAILLLFGLLMVTSASLPASIRFYGTPYQFTFKTTIHLVIALVAGGFVCLLPMRFWHNNSLVFFVLVILLLCAVLVGNQHVKGATRWLNLGGFTFQPSELAKLALFCLLANYLSKKWKELAFGWNALLLPLGFALIFVLLLLLQPDLGSSIVLLAVTFGIIYLVGATWYSLLGLFSLGLAGLAGAVLLESYRWRRVIAFLDPWGDPYNTGYQLVNSLIAIGYGGFSGQGLGNSILKQGYLPEVYTDFIFSIIAEELGFCGAIATIILLLFLVLRILLIGLRAVQAGHHFSGFFAYQIGMGLGIQTIINIGMTMGLLPTKGLTLPLISYGGSSLMVTVIMIAIALRIDYETKQTINRLNLNNG